MLKFIKWFYRISSVEVSLSGAVNEIRAHSKAFLVTATLVFLLIFTISCDGSFHSEGIVYEWVSPPAGEFGAVFIEPDKPANGLDLLPLPLAQITFFDRAGSQGPGCSIPSRNFERNTSLDTISLATGRFETGKVVSPGTYPMKIVINKPGYYPIEKDFLFEKGGGRFTFTILLVRKP